MEFVVHRPAPPLSAIVETITYFSSWTPDHLRERLIPDGAIEIIVDLTERPKRLFDTPEGGTGRDFRQAWISGMHRSPIIIEAQAQSSMFVIRFRPGAMRAVIGHDAESLTDRVEPLADVVGSAASSLRDRLLEARGAAARIAAGEAWLRERWRQAPIAPPPLTYALRRLADPAGARIADIAEDAGVSARQLQNLFRKWVGVSPKQYARIRRFQSVLAALSPGRGEGAADLFLRGEAIGEPDWARLAAATGYADQPHLVHEFRAFSGVTPGTYVSAYRGLSNYLPIGVA
jgi:AraC-like DNA-binding protein